MEGRFVLFVVDGCPYCTSAIELLEEKELEHSVYDFKGDRQMTVLNEIKKKHDWKTVPMVFFLTQDQQPEFIGGYTDLVQHFEGTDGRVE